MHLPHTDAKALWRKFCSVAVRAAEQGLLGIKLAEVRERRCSCTWEEVFPRAERVAEWLSACPNLVADCGFITY